MDKTVQDVLDQAVTDAFERRRVERAERARVLEGWVDDIGTSCVLDLLSGVCSGKADHLRSAWQDESSARAWDRVAGMLNRLSGRVDGLVG